MCTLSRCLVHAMPPQSTKIEHLPRDTSAILRERYLAGTFSVVTQCTWVLPAPDGPHVGPMNLAIRVSALKIKSYDDKFVITDSTVGCHNDNLHWHWRWQSYHHDNSVFGEFEFVFCEWVRSRMCSCLVTWFCYHLIAKPGNKTAAPSWPDPYHHWNREVITLTSGLSLKALKAVKYCHQLRFILFFHVVSCGKPYHTQNGYIAAIQRPILFRGPNKSGKEYIIYIQGFLLWNRW